MYGGQSLAKVDMVHGRPTGMQPSARSIPALVQETDLKVTRCLRVGE
jgi:hypothetical protein